jgi:hypothetical protein
VTSEREDEFHKMVICKLSSGQWIYIHIVVNTTSFVTYLSFSLAFISVCMGVVL